MQRLFSFASTILRGHFEKLYNGDMRIVVAFVALAAIGCMAPEEEGEQVSPGSVEMKREGANLRMKFALHNVGEKPIEGAEVIHIAVGKKRAKDIVIGTIAPKTTAKPEVVLTNVKPGIYSVYYSYYYPKPPKGFKGKKPMGQRMEFQHDAYEVP